MGKEDLLGSLSAISYRHTTGIGNPGKMFLEAHIPIFTLYRQNPSYIWTSYLNPFWNSSCVNKSESAKFLMCIVF